MFTIKANSKHARRFEALLEMVMLDDQILPHICDLLEEHYMRQNALQTPAKGVA